MDMFTLPSPSVFQKRVPEVPSTSGGGGGHPAQDYPDFPQGLLPR